MGGDPITTYVRPGSPILQVFHPKTPTRFPLESTGLLVDSRLKEVEPQSEKQPRGAPENLQKGPFKRKGSLFQSYHFFS